MPVFERVLHDISTKAINIFLLDSKYAFFKILLGKPTAGGEKEILLINVKLHYFFFLSLGSGVIISFIAYHSCNCHLSDESLS